MNEGHKNSINVNVWLSLIQHMYADRHPEMSRLQENLQASAQFDGLVGFSTLTIQAAVVVLPICADGILFADKHHFSDAHLHQARSLQGAAHAEQLLCTNGCERAKVHNESSRVQQGFMNMKHKA